MRITSISVTKLFGKFDHVIPLNMDERITIIYGPNGIGKTVLFRMLNDLLQGRDFSEIPFMTFQVDLDDGNRIIVTQETNTPAYTKNSSGGMNYVIGCKNTRFIHPLPPAPEWFAAVRRALTIRLIDTQRLDGQNGTVLRCSGELRWSLKLLSERSKELAQNLDRTFPARVVTEEVAAGVTVDSLRNDFMKLEERRARLEAIGVLDEGTIEIPSKIDEGLKNFFAVYIADGNKKLDIFDDVAQKCALLQEIINSRFLHKRMEISTKHGFMFLTDEGQELSPSVLSTGEQHEIVLFYDLLFNTKPNTLFLIDEPEISLHVYWQRQFLRDLQKISALASFDALIATHSPQIIHDRGDLTVELEELEVGEHVA